MADTAINGLTAKTTPTSTDIFYGVTSPFGTGDDFKVTGDNLGKALNASVIPNTPAGNIAATNVQAAINELDTEKATDTLVVKLAGAQTITGTKTHSAAINQAKGADIASATTTDIGAATGNFVHITGITTITGLGTVQAGTQRKVEFAGILTLTHNATSLILPTAANITTAAGDTATFVSEGAGNWRCTDYQRADGTALAAAAGGADGVVLVTSRADSLATTQSIAHGLSGIPKLVFATGYLSDARSSGGYDGTNNKCVYFRQGGGITGNQTTQAIYLESSGLDGMKATITVDATNVNIQWALIKNSVGSTAHVVLKVTL